MIKKSIKKMLLYTQLFNKMSCQISLVFKKLNGGLVANIQKQRKYQLIYKATLHYYQFRLQDHSLFARTVPETFSFSGPRRYRSGTLETWQWNSLSTYILLWTCGPQKHAGKCVHMPIPRTLLRRHSQLQETKTSIQAQSLFLHFLHSIIG